jgi:hypothetical protein
VRFGLRESSPYIKYCIGINTIIVAMEKNPANKKILAITLQAHQNREY